MISVFMLLVFGFEEIIILFEICSENCFFMKMIKSNKLMKNICKNFFVLFNHVLF